MCVVIRRPCGARSASQSRFVSAIASAKTSHTATLQPSATSWRTSSRPTPVPPPVTTEILPTKSFMMSYLPWTSHRSTRKRALDGPVRHQSRPPSLMALRRSLLLSLPVRIDAPIGTEPPIPEIVDYREIAISIPVVEKMELLLSPEPCKSSQCVFRRGSFPPVEGVQA